MKKKLESQINWLNLQRKLKIKEKSELEKNIKNGTDDFGLERYSVLYAEYLKHEIQNIEYEIINLEEQLEMEAKNENRTS